MLWDFFPGAIDPIAGFIAFPDQPFVNVPTQPQDLIEQVYVRGTPGSANDFFVGGSFDN